jgi:hypothetical protein
MSFIRCRCSEVVKKFDNERTFDSNIGIPKNYLELPLGIIVRQYGIRALNVESKAVAVSAMYVSLVAVAFRIRVCCSQFYARLSW